MKEDNDNKYKVVSMCIAEGIIVGVGKHNACEMIFYSNSLCIEELEPLESTNFIFLPATPG